MSRPPLLKSYKENMATYISRTKGIPYEQAEALVREIMMARYKAKTAVLLDTVHYGDPKIVAVDLATFFDQQSERIISANGCVFKQQEEMIGVTANMVKEKLAQRKVLKKKMLKAKAEGDDNMAAQCHAGQTLIKINVNSLPGSYGSAYNLNYAKDLYNSITSNARALIGYAYSTAEAVLGGNFAWFTEDELVNHITIHMTPGIIDKDEVRGVINRHHMKVVNKQELLDFYTQEVRKYKPKCNMEKVKQLVDVMTPEEVQFFYYFQNLRHIMWGNDSHFRTWVDDTFDLTKIQPDNDLDPYDLFKLEGDLVNLVNVSFSDILKPADPSTQVYDFPDKEPALAKKLIAIARHINEQFGLIQDVLDCFVYTKLCTPYVQTRKFMKRNTAVISDTDSVIFTVKDWIDWYTRDVYKITDGTYKIASCAIYWLTKAVAHSLLLYSRAHGCRGEYERTMAMKNEFLYPTMILADIKKHYAGIVTIQEGVVLPKPDPDIKGVQFKGSDICKAATKFAENFIVNKILLKSMDGKFSALDLIEEVVRFENRMQDEIKAGSTEWYKALSIRTKNYYATPLSSNYLYYMAWDEIFAEKYGELMLPTKAPVVPIFKPTPQYIEWLTSKNKSICNKFLKFIEKYGKHPAYVAINPVTGRVPEELVPIIDTRSIIYHNIKPAYLILQQIGIMIPFSKDELLLSEMYKF